MQPYIDILISTSLEIVVQKALQRFVQLSSPSASCLLLWDAELGRYTVGDTMVQDSDIKPAIFRRVALRHASNEADATLDEGLQCFQLHVGDNHVGLIVSIGAGELEAAEAELFCSCVSHAIYTNFRLEIAEREHQQLEADTKRLEQLLHAVEQQQRTIDGLLTNEREWSAELERRVAERTDALRDTQKRLIQSEKLAVIGQLASSLAHELNNPLQAIQSGVGLMIDDLQAGHTDQVQTDLEVIEEELERIQSIFRQMLDFYRPSHNEHVMLDLNAICTSVSVLMRKRLQNSNIDLTLSLSDHLPITYGDRNQIKQILINLILNATEAMDDIGGTIQLKTTANDNYAILVVEDNGPGIQHEHLQHLFEPLFTTKTRGLGLGLSICEDIAQQHDGYIDVSTKIGTGTAFALHLPIQQGEPA